jgi:hypothetical protein
MADTPKVALSALGKVNVYDRSIGWEQRRLSGKNLPVVADPDRSRSVEFGLRVSRQRRELVRVAFGRRRLGDGYLDDCVSWPCVQRC